MVFRRVPRTLLAASTALLVAAATALLAGCGDDARKVEIIDIPGADGPELVTTGYGKAWFAPGGVTPIDEDTREEEDTVGMPGAVEGLATGEGAVWAALGDGFVVRIDPGRQRHGRRVRVGPESFDADRIPIAAGAGGVWTAVEDSVVPIDPSNGKPRDPIRVDGTTESIAAGNGAVWVAVGVGTRRGRGTSGLPPEKGTLVPRDRELVADDSRDDRLIRIDPSSGEMTADVQVPGIRDLALLGPALWASTNRGLERFDPRTLRRLGEPIDVEEGVPRSIAAGHGAIWGTIASGNLIVRVDPDAREVTRRWQIPSAAGPVSAEVGDLAVGTKAVWIGTVVGPRIGVIGAP